MCSCYARSSVTREVPLIFDMSVFLSLHTYQRFVLYEDSHSHNLNILFKLDIEFGRFTGRRNSVDIVDSSEKYFEVRKPGKEN
jgi:hypothetical protein